mgnify:CR=1 FL=1
MFLVSGDLKYGKLENGEWTETESGKPYIILVLKNNNDNDADNNTIYIPAEDLVDVYTVTDTDTVDMTLTGLDIKYYILVDTEALIKLVNLIGGVEFDVPIDMDYDDSMQDLHIHLKKGYQTLTGEQAEQVVRFRHNNDGSSYPYEYGNEDYGRMKTQREFLKAVLKQTIKLGNVTKINKFIDIGSKYVKTNINIKDIKDYVPYVIDFKLNDLKTATLPGVSEKCNGVWVFINNQEETEILINEMFLTKDPEKIKEQEEGNLTIENETVVDEKDNDENEIVDTDITASDIKDEETVKSNGITIELINGASTKNQLAIVENLLTNAGKHSKLGELIAKSIIESIHVAIKKQVWITPNSQSNVLVLLNRYKLDINEFYDGLNQNKHDFILQLKIDSKIQENIAITSSILNLIDDFKKGIINKNTAYDLSFNLLEGCVGNTVNYLLLFWIEKFLG